MAEKMKTKELLELLRRHYIKPGDWPGGVFIPECGINGGGGGRVDALYVGFTSTSGRRLVGHELKVSRSDWLHELAQHGKADLWADNCHQWYVVAPGPEVVPQEEIPHGWGLLYPSPRTRTRMRVVVKAPVVEREPSWTIVRSIMSRLDTLQTQARGAWETDLRQKVTAEVTERVESARQGARLTPAQDQRLAWLEQMEHSLGANLASRWDLRDHELDGQRVAPEQIVAALRLVQAADQARPHNRNRYLAQQMRQDADRMLAGAAAYEAAMDAFAALTDGRAALTPQRGES